MNGVEQFEQTMRWLRERMRLASKVWLRMQALKWLDKQKKK